MGLLNVKSLTEDIKDIKDEIKENQILIESTADISVRNFWLMMRLRVKVIYTVLHQLATLV